MSAATTTPNTPTGTPLNKKRGWRVWFARLLALKLTKVPRVHPTLRVPRLPGGFVQLIKPGVKYEKVSVCVGVCVHKFVPVWAGVEEGERNIKPLIFFSLVHLTFFFEYRRLALLELLGDFCW